MCAALRPLVGRLGGTNARSSRSCSIGAFGVSVSCMAPTASETRCRAQPAAVPAARRPQEACAPAGWQRTWREEAVSTESSPAPDPKMGRPTYGNGRCGLFWREPRERGGVEAAMSHDSSVLLRRLSITHVRPQASHHAGGMPCAATQTSHRLDSTRHKHTCQSIGWFVKQVRFCISYRGGCDL